MDSAEQEKKNNGKSGMISAAAVLFLLLIYAPLETYVTNINDFTYDLADLMKVMLPVFILCSAAAAAVIRILHRTCRPAGIAADVLCAAVMAGLYIQGTFLSGNLPQLDGGGVDWAQYDYQRLPSVVLWSALAAVSAILVIVLVRNRNGNVCGKTEKALAGISGAVLAFLVLSSVLLCLQRGVADDKTDVIVTDAYISEFSEKENFVILLLDMVDGTSFSEYLDAHPETDDLFRDFTYYTDTMGAYPFTLCSIPYILSGEWFEYQCPFGEYQKKAYNDSALLAELGNRGYRLGLYESESVSADSESLERFENFTSPAGNRFAHPVWFIKMQIHFAGLKYFPYDMKRLCMLEPYHIRNNSLKDFGDAEVWNQGNFEYYGILDNGFTKSADCCFRFIHLEGVHPPFNFDRYFNAVEDAPLDEVLGSCFTLTEKFLSAFRDSGMYDNSVVVIMSDHGGIGTRTNPILLIKGRSENHEFERNAAPIAFSDLREGFLSLLDGAAGSNVFPWREGDVRERRFLNYRVLGNDPFEEMITVGKSDEAVPTGNLIIKEE